MRKRWMVLILFVLSLSFFALTTYAQDATAEPTAEATAIIEAPTAEVTVEATTVLEAPTAEVTAEATTAVEPVPPTAVPTEGNTGGEGAPTGLSTLVLLMGLGAVSVVGLLWWRNENLRNQSGNKS